MGSLNNTAFYLAGPIDAAADDGVGWRRQFVLGSVERGFNMRFLDPSNKPIKFRKEVGHEKVEIKDLKRQHKWKEIAHRVDEFSRADLRAVDIADAVIVYVDHDVHMCGSYFEVERAFQQQKPMFLVVKGGRENCPPWLFGKFKADHMFDSVDNLLDHLEELNHRTLGNEWVLLDDWIGCSGGSPLCRYGFIH